MRYSRSLSLASAGVKIRAKPLAGNGLLAQVCDTPKKNKRKTHKVLWALNALGEEILLSWT
ncbi:MAG: hypothetical protein P8N49_01435 [Opitutales bacterium]|nr:hypothetical protein [Opitutales bacterium]